MSEYDFSGVFSRVFAGKIKPMVPNNITRVNQIIPPTFKSVNEIFSQPTPSPTPTKPVTVSCDDPYPAYICTNNVNPRSFTWKQAKSVLVYKDLKHIINVNEKYLDVLTVLWNMLSVIMVTRPNVVDISTKPHRGKCLSDFMSWALSITVSEENKDVSCDALLKKFPEFLRTYMKIPVYRIRTLRELLDAISYRGCVMCTHNHVIYTSVKVTVEKGIVNAKCYGPDIQSPNESLVLIGELNSSDDFDNTFLKYEHYYIAKNKL